MSLPVQASDHLNLEEGLPIEVEDAYPIPYKGLELQGRFTYQRNHGDDFFGLEPRIEYGFAPNWQGKITVPFLFGSAVSEGIGDVGVYDQEEEENTDAYLLELGIRYQADPLTVLTVGAGAGLTSDSPDFRINLGFQRSF